MQVVQDIGSNVIAQRSYDLVNGDFTNKEATEIINQLFHTIINYHKIENLSHHVRYNNADNSSLKNIEELNITKASIDKLIEHFKIHDMPLKVVTKITIELL